MSALPAPLLSSGVQLYKYQLVAFLGKGRFGEVWLAQDLALTHSYAVKILNPGIPIDQRLREAQIGHRLKHNNLVQVHQADVCPLGNDHVVIIAMDYLADGSIVRQVNPSNFLPLPKLMQVAKDILQGLDYLHANHFFHNDIKPENILIGSAGQAMLADYGIVGVSPDGQPVEALGAYRFHMAPEVVTGRQIDVLTDIYQVGLTLYRLINGLSHLRTKQGTMGWDGYHAAAAQGELITVRDFAPYVPPALRRIILKAISPSRSERFQTALEMRRAIEKLDFPGSWTVSAAGQLIGSDGRFDYRFEKSPIGQRFAVKSFRKNRSSNNETRISDFCGQNLTKGEADALIGRFMKHVVAGS